MAYRAGVVGGSGYTGAELLRLLAGHTEIEVVHVTAESNAGATVAALYPSLASAYPRVEYSAYDPADVAGLDVVFLALPHGESQRIAPELVERVGHVVDLGADFRLPAGAYEQWYGHRHAAPQLLERFAFGLPELFRDAVTRGPHVAAPGCYPTAAALALAPLLAGELVEPNGIVVDAMSGVSGRGRGLSAPSLFSEANESVAPYGLLTHRHTGEMEWALSAASSADVTLLFTPHLVPMTRGLLATCHARPSRGGLTTASLIERFRAFYAGAPFIGVVDVPPVTKATLGSNAAHLTVRFDDRTGSVLSLCALDNLGKGAAGQAIQCANLVLGLPEATGLPAVGIMP
ncbi:MAG TPA: N-acetyl-gamma-glutamyl-phosphate reductase [Acidimicrobiia bacterium]|nr:N-acetyl-gamma-glutamyl-phosphate reductase [Acidimicrobiia bacterium]